MTKTAPIVARHKPIVDAAAAAPTVERPASTTAAKRPPIGRVLVAAALLLTSVAFVLRPQASIAAPAHDDQIVRLYNTALGRMPDAEGLAYWSERRESGESLVDLAREMIELPEAQEVSSGDFIVDAYRNALDRDPENDGYVFWAAFDDPAEAIASIADSDEHVLLTGTLPPPIATAATTPSPSASTSTDPNTLAEIEVAVPAGWVDAGHGVYVPPILLSIRYCESRDIYTAANTRSSARGAYQFLTISWRGYGHAERYGVSSADQATPAQQDEAALITWQRDGTRPWYASRHCWS